ncbi:MAG: hypothetical protein L0H53_14075 [Candidatus Nitrosocosmicus sp.]|nr:hypothetical protein [Candidatus Nitrosocosmicus sp.]MDN5868571.1 hypothetical protein [Candidatus Nitrosocosmicus sp.]
MRYIIQESNENVYVANQNGNIVSVIGLTPTTPPPPEEEPRTIGDLEELFRIHSM